MVAGQASGIVQSPFGIIGTDVILMPLAQLLNGILNMPAAVERGIKIN